MEQVATSFRTSACRKRSWSDKTAVAGHLNAMEHGNHFRPELMIMVLLSGPPSIQI
jgi:hypothetical protein